MMFDGDPEDFQPVVMFALRTISHLPANQVRRVIPPSEGFRGAKSGRGSSGYEENTTMPTRFPRRPDPTGVPTARRCCERTLVKQRWMWEMGVSNDSSGVRLHVRN